MVVEAANHKECWGQQGPLPKSKDAKKLDLFDWKVYSTGGLQLCIVNQQAVRSLCAYNSWNSLANFQELLPADSRSEFGVVLEEGKVVARTSLQAALDSVDSTTCTMAPLVAMRRSSWLEISGLLHEVQNTIQDLPFDCSGASYISPANKDIQAPGRPTFLPCPS
ncbi:hypothetical protein UY3_08977 [Chelonia mydas]|uniref:Uncharacterized protein n=1 Tax=Chelonia mydas TaxID=8469 RepID=M7BPH3_CHEMY|nr:hypothetical protein UY3_08977 [Chelonia mydas]